MTIDALILPIAAHSQQPDAAPGASDAQGASGASEAPRQIHVMPLGVMQGRDGRGPYELPASDMQRVIDATLAQAAGGLVPIDYDHALTRGGGEAAGWMTGLEARPDGIWANVEWTPKGEQAVASKGYRFISPVFRYAKNGGRVLRIEHAALTNLPNLDVQAIASRLGSLEDGEDDMDLLAELRQTFGLPDTADAAAVAAHAKGLKDKPAAPPTQPDPTAFVPMDKFLALGNQLNALQAQVASAAHSKAVDAAITEGKATPAERDVLLAIASQTPDQFEKLMAARQPLPQSQRMLPGGGAAPASRDDGLTATDLAVASQLGLAVDAVAATRKTEAA